MLENYEVWKDIPHYEGKYQVSNYGRVWSIARQQYKSQRLDRDGYFRVSLVAKNGKLITERVNRLVALAFIPRVEGKNIVNHINSNRQDNRVENLEWVDASGNMKHGYENGRISENQKKATEKAREVNTKNYLVYKDGELIGSYMGLKNVSSAIGICESTIRNCIKENRKSRNGYYFAIGEGGGARA